MMKLKKLGSNMTLIKMNDCEILYSYETPVAALRYSDHEYLRTDLFWSVTTSRHINQWLQGVEAQEISQDDLYKMAGGDA
jgi:hypothetical protein